MNALANDLSAALVAMPQSISNASVSRVPVSSAPVLRVVHSARPLRHLCRLFAVLALALGLTSAVMVGFATLVSGWGQI